MPSTPPRYELDTAADLDAEASVLGSVLLSPAIMSELVLAVRPEEFHRENHAAIFRSMIELFAAGEPIDVLTLADALHRKNELDRIGGRAYLAMIMENVPTASNALHYSKIVRNLAKKREAMSIVHNALRQINDPMTEVDDFLNKTTSRLFALVASGVQSDLEEVGGLVSDFIQRLDSIRGTSYYAGIASGFTDLDRLTRGFQKSELTIVGARPGMGKTSLVLNIATDLAINQDIPVGIFSLEMSKTNLIDRLVAQLAGVDSTKLRDGTVTDDEYIKIMDASQRTTRARLVIDDNPRLDEISMYAKARLMSSQHHMQLMIVDYLQLMQGNGGNREQEVSSIARAIRNVARELKIPVMAVAQLSRQPEMRANKRPILSDFRESGEIENAADVVIGLYRHAYYDPETDEEERLTGIGEAELEVLKHRNGPTGRVYLNFVKHITQFQNRSKRNDPRG